MAQGETFFVDPVNGSDVNSGGASDPFQSLTQALSVARALGTTGHEIQLFTGTYTEVGSLIGNSLESWPIELLPGTSVRAGNLQVPVFDGEGTAQIFALLENFTVSTSLSEVEVVNCGVGIANLASANLRGFVLEDSRFTFSSTGAFFQFDGTLDNQVLVRDCEFIGESSAADVGVDFYVTGGGGLSGGSVESCLVTGCNIGIQVEASDGAGGLTDYAVGTGFLVKGNEIEDFLPTANSPTGSAGIKIASKSGTVGVCRVGCLVSGNEITGPNPGSTPPAGQVGLYLESSNQTGGGLAALMESSVQYNEIIGCETGVKLETNGGTANQADLTSEFLGNLIQLASGDGVAFEVNGFAPSPLSNNLPNFGTYGSFLEAGRNVIASNGGSAVALDSDMDFFLSMPNFHGNWWDPSAVSEASVLTNFISLNGASNFGTAQLSPVFQFSMEATVSPSTITEGATPLVTVTAGGGFFPTSAFFHDADTDSLLENMVVTVGNVPIDLSDSETVLASDGSSLAFRFPDMSVGTYNLNLQNPGGPFVVDNGNGVQPSFQVNAPSESEDSGGPCFIASVAFEDPHSPAVETLRHFRDRWLLTWPGGRIFVGWYYEHGPTAAQWLEQRPWARATTRLALIPPIGIAEALESWNLGQRLLAAIALLGIAFGFGRKAYLGNPI